MSNVQWEEIPQVRGAFIGWGTTAGQHVTGKIMEYAPTGGRDFNDEPCPQLAIELIEAAASFNKAGERTDYPAGEIVNLTVGQAALKSALKRADPTPGDLVKIALTGMEKTNRGNTVKTFSVKIARGAGGTPAPQTPAPQAAAQAMPPF